MEECPERDRGLPSPARPGNSLHLLDGERPEALAEGRIVPRRVETHHHLVEVTVVLYLRPSEYRRQLEVNMISPLVVIQAFAPLLGTDHKRQGPIGRIVN